MIKIEIDDQVMKELQKKAIPFEDTPNSVLRRLLGFENANNKNSIPGPETKIIPVSISTVQDVPLNITNFLEGKRLWRRYKGKDYYVDVKNGKYVIDGKEFYSPSAVAVHVTGNPVNGWIFWRYYDSNKDRWSLIDKLRKN